MPFTNDSKSDTSPTWKKYLRRGAATQLGDMANLTFEDIISEDGDPVLKDAAIDSFAASTTTNDSKSSSPTWTNDPLS